MTPQLVDLNADGYQDMVMATFEGTAFVVAGTDQGWKDPKHIKDSAGTNVRIAMYYDMDANEYKDVDRSDDSYESDPGHHMTSIALVDWDEDGDQDLILGAYEGPLYLCMNEGTAEKADFAKTNQQLKVGGKPMMIDGGLATPRIADWNGDGLFDIICGGTKGGVYLFQNAGEKGKPKFNEIETLVAKTVKDEEPNWDEEGELDEEAFYSDMMVPSKNGMPTCPGSSFHVEVVDYDGDGDLDLLVGGQSYFKSEAKVRTEEEEKELVELRAKMEKIQVEMQAFYEGKEPEEMEKVWESEEFQKVSEQMNGLWERMNELDPYPEPANLIWLYRNKGGNAETSTIEPVAKSEPKFDRNEFGVHASFSPSTAKAGEEVTLVVKVNVPDGYHIYGSKNKTFPTKLSISEKGGLESVGKANVPSGRRVLDDGKSAYWLQNVITIEQKMVVPAGFESGSVAGTVNYMMCDERACNPPAKEKFTAELVVK